MRLRSRLARPHIVLAILGRDVLDVDCIQGLPDAVIADTPGTRFHGTRLVAYTGAGL
jgi:hypothetical protein